MKFSAPLALVAATLVSVSSASPLVFNEDEQITVPIQIPFLAQEPKILTFPNWFAAKDDDDICPDLKVRCVRDGEVVGDIGKQTFVRNGVTCEQKNPTKNKAQCNAKYLIDCKTQCDAEGPLGGKAKSAKFYQDKVHSKFQEVSAMANEGYSAVHSKWMDLMAGDEDDICPDLKAKCVNKDGETVGDIGKKSFCRNGVKCELCHQTEADAECNLRNPIDCKAQCQASGPLGGKTLKHVSHKAEQAYQKAAAKVADMLDGDDDDICPDMKVSCSKDGKKVGSIGKKPFCRDGLTCGQCHSTENTAECNAKYLVDCKAQCEATGPLGGKSVFVHLFE